MDSAPDIAVVRFYQWWEHGRKRLVNHEVFEQAICEKSFLQGWHDARNHVSDFKRRGMSHDTGERAAYMAGRFLGVAHKVRS